RDSGHRRCIEKGHGPTLAVFQGSRTCDLLRLSDLKLIDASSRSERCSQTSLSTCISFEFDRCQIRFQASPIARALPGMVSLYNCCCLWKRYRKLVPK